MKKRTIYIFITVLSLIIMIALLNFNREDNQDTSSYYYTYYNTQNTQKNYFTYKQSDYIESFFIQCTVLNNHVVSIQDTNKKQPTFVYKGQNCWVYSLSAEDFIIKRGRTIYEAKRLQVEKLAKQLKNFSIDNIENIK